MFLRKNYKRASAILLLSMVCMFAFAQGREVTGTVVDETGTPIIGANILEAGTTNGVITDLDGNFRLTVQEDAQIQVSYIGFVSQVLRVGRQSHLNVILKEDMEALDEVVVVGYGIMKKRDLTGAVSSVRSADLQKVASSNAMQAMQAKVPGLDIQQSDGQAGASLSINLRGNRSLAAGNDPLILVDGVEYGSTLDINPSDIESMEILKDASSTAIYGTKGANGVIIITTKRGLKGSKTQVNFNAYVSMNSPTNIPKSMYGMQEVQRLIDKANYQDDYVSGNWGSANNTIEDVLGTNALSDGTLMTDIVSDGSFTNWADLILKNSVTQNYEVSVSGGSEKTNFNLSLGLMRDNGLMRNDQMSRYNVKANVDHVINNVFTVGTSLLYTYKSQDKRNSGVFSQSMKMTTITHAYLSDGSINATPNPLYAAHCSPLLDDVDGAYQHNIETSRFFGNVYAQITPFKGLVFKSLFNLDRQDEREGEYQDYESQQRYQSPRTSYMSNERTSNTKYTWQNTLNYNVSFNGGFHDLTVLLGHEMTQSVTESLLVEGDMGAEHYYESSFYDVSKLGNVTPISTYTKTSMLSYFGRVNYKLANRYLLTASIRADGSSVLAEGNKWGYFPSVALGWSLNEESFLRDVTWLDQLKVRASWGLSGNSAIDAYETLGNLTATVSGGSDMIPASLANENLTWETTSSFDIGLDFSFLHNRIAGSVDYFWSKTSDLLYYASQPASSVFTSVIDNVGSTKGQGIEVALNTLLVKTKDFSWDANWSYTHFQDEVTELSEGVDRNISGNTGFIVGAPVSIYYDYEADGTWGIGEYEQYLADYQERHNGESPSWTVANYGDPGTIKIVDQNDDGVIDDNDRIVYNRSPKHIIGMNNTFTYKDFSLSVQLYARLGGYISYSMNEQLNYESANWGDLDYWTPTNQNAKFPSPGLSSTQQATYTTYATALLYEKASYFKIKDITLSYNLPKNFLSKMYIGGARVYASLKNFFTFSGIDNYDPERGGSISFPLQKQVVVGLNVQF